LEELRAARKLLEAQGTEIRTLNEVIVLERKISEALKNLRTLDAKQIEELNAALAAKDRVIANVEAANAVLKKNQWSLGKALKWAAYGTAGAFETLIAPQSFNGAAHTENV
jgi:hypothetical protein